MCKVHNVGLRYINKYMPGRAYRQKREKYSQTIFPVVIKVINMSQNSRNKGFFLLFFFMMEGSRFVSGSRSESRFLQILTDPDPEQRHWLAEGGKGGQFFRVADLLLIYLEEGESEEGVYDGGRHTRLSLGRAGWLWRSSIHVVQTPLKIKLSNLYRFYYRVKFTDTLTRKVRILQKLLVKKIINIFTEKAADLRPFFV